MSNVDESIKRRFFKFIRKTESCWFWLGGKDLHFWVNGKNECARRFSYVLSGNPLDKDSLVQLIPCKNNDKCINPSHLIPLSKEDYFLINLNKTKTCWNWGPVTKGHSYGRMSVNGKRVYAHRYSYEYFNKSKIPDHLVVRHKCDNPRCVNPEHLILGTQKDNIHDAIRRKRLMPEYNGRKVSEMDVLNIREIYRTETISQEMLGKRFGLCRQAVGNILRRKTWRSTP